MFFYGMRIYIVTRCMYREAQINADNKFVPPIHNIVIKHNKRVKKEPFRCFMGTLMTSMPLQIKTQYFQCLHKLCMCF